MNSFINDRKYFSNKLKKLNLTNEQAGNLLNVTSRQIYNYKAGKHPIPNDIMKRIDEVSANYPQDIRFDEKPIWLRIKNFELPNENSPDYFYYLTENSEIELYDPDEEKKVRGDNRIYLKFVNTSIIENKYYGIIKFSKQYGFLGQTSNVERNGDYEKLINCLISYDKPGNYLSNKLNINRLKEGIYNFKPYSKLSTKMWAKKHIGHIPKGYFESASDSYHYFVSDLVGVLMSLNQQSIDEISMHYCNLVMNWQINELIPIFNMDSSVSITFSYNSLISYMYYELMEDLKNGICAVSCWKCHKWFLGGNKTNKPKYCDVCSTRSKLS